MNVKLRLFIIVFTMAVCGTSFGAPIKAVIVDGQNNHKWKATSPILEKHLLETGLFSVDVATSPPGGESQADFNPAFKDYDVVVLNYNGDLWNKNTQQAFLDYVRNGGGVVVVHAANNAFGQWKEYNEIIGIGGWGDRNKASGPYCYLVDGKLVHDHESDGPGGGHEGYAEIVIDNHAIDHPILKGMPAKWYQQDELYNFLRGPGQNMKVLATAYSARPKDKGGSGRHEPMLMTLTYGEGQVFHTTLGHDVRSVKGKGFALTYTRGAEWVATGQVSIPAPKNIPGPMTPLEAIAVLNEGNSYIPMNQLITEFGALADAPGKRAELEALLIGYVEDPETPFLALQAICEALGVAGSQASVPALAKLLAKDARHASAARLALEHIPGPKATRALLDALKKEEEFNQVAIIHSLARRREAGAEAHLATLTEIENTAVARAAIGALGKIGNPEAMAALELLPPSDDKTAALMACAYRLIEGGEKTLARAAFHALLEEDNLARHRRTAALHGLLMADPKEAMAYVWAELEDETKSAAALNALAGVPGDKQLATDILDHFDGLPTSTQITLLATLGGMAQPVALPRVLTLARTSEDAGLRATAVVTLGHLPGNSASLAFLNGEATNEESAVQKIAHKALVSSPGTDAEAIIIQGIGSGATDARIEYMDVAKARYLEKACPALLKAAVDTDLAIQEAAYSALRTLAGPDEYDALIALAVAASEEVRGAAVRAAQYAGRKVNDDKARLRSIAAAQEAHGEVVQIAFMPVLTDIGSPAALKRITSYAKSDSEALRSAAIDNLGKWKDATAIDTALLLAKSTSSAERRAPLMGAFSKLIAKAKNVPDEKKLDQCKQALAIGLDISGKKTLLNALGSVIDVGALEIIETLGKEPELAEVARRVAPAIKQKLLGTPGLTASHNARDLERAIDGDPGSRWSTNAFMKPGMWLGIDLRMQSEVYAITLDSTRSAGDYPRGYDVFISADYEDMGVPVATGKGAGPVTRIEFEKPVKGRHIKIVQTGEHDLFWSIHELTVAHDPGLEAIPLPQTALKDFLEGDGLITNWNVAGPFTKAGKDGKALFNNNFGPEVDAELALWSPLESDVIRGGIVDLEKLYGGDNRVAYLAADIVADESRKVTLGLGSDDGIKVWLNGTLVHQNPAVRPVEKDSDQVSVRLEKGSNTLLLKVIDYGGHWGACARVSTPAKK
jgi:uncharacterized protein